MDVTMTIKEHKDLPELFQELGELRVRVAHIEEALEKLDKVSTQLDSFLTQSKGVAKTLQILFYIIGPAIAAIYWIKDHVK